MSVHTNFRTPAQPLASADPANLIDAWASYSAAVLDRPGADDTAILQAWAVAKDADRRSRQEGLTEHERGEFENACDKAEEIILDTPSTTLAGATIQLWQAFAHSMAGCYKSEDWIREALLSGDYTTLFDRSRELDCHQQLILHAIRCLQSLGASSPTPIAGHNGIETAEGAPLVGDDGTLHRTLTEETAAIALREATERLVSRKWETACVDEYAQSWLKILTTTKHNIWVSFEGGGTVALNVGIAADDDEYPALRLALLGHLPTVDGARAAIMDLLVGQGRASGPSFIPNERARTGRPAEMAH